MALWILLALMTGAAVLAVLWPLSRTATSRPEPESDVPFYRSQLAEIERDQARGALAAAEAEAARVESGRRLLRAAAEAPGTVDATSEPALRRRRAASALALSVIPIIALALYGGLGSPHLPDQPISARLVPAAMPTDAASALIRLEDHLARQPGDARGWDLVAPIYLRAGRFADAARAYARARQAGGDTAERLLGEGQALVSAAEGTVGAEARDRFRRALERDGALPAARYYLALGDEQDGHSEAARSSYRALLAGAPPGALWVPLVQGRLARLDGAASPPAPARPAALPPSAVTPEIAAMVSGLDERLKAQGGSEAEWTRLVRSFMVLGQTPEAQDRLSRARTGLARDPAALERLDRLAAELGLRAEVAGR
ncbi:c-type cytochrome biogenesis protein CcmI [Enterovirga sp.]|uniref:c-type cytochrome biogenesis protein CcmI n=1 Tax=Enterovirga sp. TaxID=2026350 RepID=UPI002631AF38|nr:c-type cytochrome biogenesis protein CcmI [Enterovirga sp.]MDB5590648.1 ccmI [Enterovirga sp.]